MEIKKGTTRTVFLISSYAIKIPRFWHSSSFVHKWKMFLRGILANMDEHFWWKCAWQKDKLCPIIWRSPLGFILIMKRADNLNEKEYDKEKFEKYFKNLPLDNKIVNFGKIKDKIVLIDYADSRYLCSDCSNCWKNR